MAALRLVALCVLLATAGCASPFLPGAPLPSAPGPTVTDGPGAPASDASPVGSRTATALPSSADNPWRATEVVVGVDNRAATDRSFVPLVEAAVAYWNGPGRANATYPAMFRVVPDAEDPDVLVVFRDTVDCADQEEVLGCAPLLEASDRPPRPVEVDVAAGFSDETTLRTIEHEFGHLLGIEHGEPPMPLMAARGPSSTLPATDATEKDNPWQTDDLRVYVDLAGAEGDPETLRYQVAQAVRYYDEGAAGTVPANVSFTVVDDPSAAQIRVVFERDRGDCSVDRSQSCGFWFGYDPDADGALEYYSNGTIVVNGIDDAAVGWHVGYWLGVMMGHDEPAEHAPPFRDADYDERRSEWWA